MAKEKKKSFILYIDYREHLDLLSDEERGKLFTALFDYAESGSEPDLTGAARMAYSFIRSQMDRDAASYAETCRKRSEAGKQGGRPKTKETNEKQKKPKKANGFSEKQTEAKKANTDNDTVTDTDTDNDNDNDTVTDTDNETPPNPQGGTETQEGTDAQERRFAEFWDEYPRKVGKKAARDSWKRIKPDAKLFDSIMYAVRAAKKSQEWTKEGGRYVPHPTTWLNQGRWDDELTPATNNQQTTERRTSHAENRGNETRTLSGFRMADE